MRRISRLTRVIGSMRSRNFTNDFKLRLNQ